MSNSIFGLRHFPGEPVQFFSLPPEVPPTWDWYIMGTQDSPMFTPTADVHGLASLSTVPSHGTLDLTDAALQGPKLRFELHKLCHHWDSIHLRGNGKK